ncbi:MAG: hypothetical protein QXW71_00655 [Thermoplasmata archaeon]
MVYFLWVTEDKIHIITKEDLYQSENNNFEQEYLLKQSMTSSTFSKVFILKPSESKFFKVDLGPFSTSTLWFPESQPKKKKAIPLKYLALMKASY